MRSSFGRITTDSARPLHMVDEGHASARDLLPKTSLRTMGVRDRRPAPRGGLVFLGNTDSPLGCGYSSATRSTALVETTGWTTGDCPGVL